MGGKVHPGAVHPWPEDAQTSSENEASSKPSSGNKLFDGSIRQLLTVLAPDPASAGVPRGHGQLRVRAVLATAGAALSLVAAAADIDRAHAAPHAACQLISALSLEVHLNTDAPR